MRSNLPIWQTFVKPCFADLALVLLSDESENAAMVAKPKENRIKEVRTKCGLSLEEIADLSGLSVSYLSRMETGKRNVSLKNLRKISDALSVQPGELIATTDHASDYLQVKGEVRAGAWLEIDGDGHSDEHIPVSADQRYGRAPQFALKVIGTSMNKVAQPGQFVIVASWPELGDELKDGDLVVVRRERAMTHEITLKRARLKNGEWQLWPESTDPRHQEPIELSDGGRDVVVSIIGKVIGKYEPM